MSNPIINRRQVLNSSVGSVFNIASLGLDADLRTPNEALTDATSRNNGLIVPKISGDIATNIDVAAIIDQSQGKTLNTIYTSDHSSGLDGFIALGFVSLSGNIDGIGGEDDWLRLTTTAGSQYHIARRSGSLTIGQVYRCTAKIFCPSANSLTTSVFVGSSAMGAYHLDLTLDAVNEVDFYFIANNTMIDVLMLQGDKTSSYDITGDVLYIKNFVVSEVAGRHRTQTSAAKMGHWNNTTFTVDLDGVDDEYSDYNESLMAAVGANTQGVSVNVFDDDEGTGVALQPTAYTLNLLSSDFLLYGFTTSDTYTIRYRAASGTINEVIFSGGAQTRSGRNTMFFGSNGTEYLLTSNGVVHTVLSASVSNDGKWLGDDSLNRVETGNITATFTAFGFRAEAYRSTVLTPTEAINLKTWYDANV